MPQTEYYKNCAIAMTEFLAVADKLTDPADKDRVKILKSWWDPVQKAMDDTAANSLRARTLELMNSRKAAKKSNSEVRRTRMGLRLAGADIRRSQGITAAALVDKHQVQADYLAAARALSMKINDVLELIRYGRKDKPNQCKAIWTLHTAFSELLTAHGAKVSGLAKAQLDTMLQGIHDSYTAEGCSLSLPGQPAEVAPFAVRSGEADVPSSYWASSIIVSSSSSSTMPPP